MCFGVGCGCMGCVCVRVCVAYVFVWGIRVCGVSVFVCGVCVCVCVGGGVYVWSVRVGPRCNHGMLRVMRTLCRTSSYQITDGDNWRTGSGSDSGLEDTMTSDTNQFLEEMCKCVLPAQGWGLQPLCVPLPSSGAVLCPHRKRGSGRVVHVNLSANEAPSSRL